MDIVTAAQLPEAGLFAPTFGGKSTITLRRCQPPAYREPARPDRSTSLGNERDDTGSVLPHRGDDAEIPWADPLAWKGPRWLRRVSRRS